MRLGGALVIEDRDPAADTPQWLAGDRPRRRLQLGSGERMVQPAGIGVHQRPQRRDPVCAVGEAEVGVGAVQGQGKVVDAGPAIWPRLVSDD